MESSFKDLEAKLIFELKKVNWVEHMFGWGELDEMLAKSEANDLAKRIAEILEKNNDIENIFLEYYKKLVKLKIFDDFPGLVNDVLVFIKYRSFKDTKKHRTDENVNEIPEQMVEIRKILALDESITNAPGDNKTKLRSYVAPYLVYRINENKIIHHSDEKTKKELYDNIWGEALDSDFLNIISNVHKEYPELYKNDINKDYTDYKYDTMKKRMAKVLPTKRDNASMRSGHNLNIFEQHIMELQFLIYNTPYQRFLSNPVNGTVPDYDTYEDIKKSMLMFQSHKPVSGIEDALYQRTVIEDTFHFSVLNGVTQLIDSILNQIVKIIQITSQHESLITLIWLEEINKSIPDFTSSLAYIFSEIKDEVAKYNELENLAEVVNQAAENETSLNYSKNKMSELLDKYDSIYTDEDHGGDFERETAAELFKMIVKKFYQYEEDETAYER